MITNIGAWDLGLEEARREGWADEHTFAEGVEWGITWVFAIQGMFEAIKRTYMCWNCNCYVGPAKWRDDVLTIFLCDCDYNDDHHCGAVLSPGPGQEAK